MSQLVSQIKTLLRDVSLFSQHASSLTLRDYQRAVALAVVDSVIHQKGYSFVVCFPRQSGKNELQAQIEVYLMTLLSQSDAEIVKVSPTWKPQSLNAMRRLHRVLDKNIFTRSMWARESGYIYRVGSARIYFFSGQPEANIVGATASTLLEVDEAQDVLISKFDKDISPMAASTNATRVFWGTAWTSRTLLARELRAALASQKGDGIQRVFQLTADDVALEVPPYGEFVRGQVARLGRDHPMVKTQFFSEEIDAEGGLFSPGRLSLMQGAHPPLSAPLPGDLYAFLIDVAGEDEALTGDLDSAGDSLSNPGRDATALTILHIDTSTLSDPVIQAPSYRVVSRYLWTGIKHSSLYAHLRALAECWLPRHLVIDATGVGAGLSSFLDKAFPGRVIPFTFSSSSKSQLGWDFLAVVDSGRWKDYSPLAAPTISPHSSLLSQPSPPLPSAAGEGTPIYGSAAAGVTPTGGGYDSNLTLQSLFFRQLSFVQYEIQPGPGRLMKWSVPDGTRDPSTGSLVHDDMVLSAALCAVLDRLDWSVTGPSLLVQASDPLDELDKGF